MIIVSKLLVRKGFMGMTLWPFIIVREKAHCDRPVFLNHERIHLRQQIEMLVIFFYLWYGLEYLVRLLQYKKRFEAYKNLSFEREAYAHEKDPQYLNRRPFWRFLHYLKSTS